MSEAATTLQEPVNVTFDPFKTDIPTQPVPEAAPQPAPAAEAQPPADPPQEDPTKYQYVDVPVWLKENFGNDNVDAVKKEWEDLRKLREDGQQPFKFENKESELLFSYIKEGKIPELREHYNRQYQLEQLESADPNNPVAAEQIIKAGMKLKNPLSQEQVDFLFNQNYAKPPKPNKGADEEDADYSIRVSEWEQKVKDINTKMSIDALMAKPDILKLKSEAKLPDIQLQQPQPAGPTQKELDDQKRYVDAYIKSVDDQLKGFNGYDVTFKDEAVEIPISYVVTDQEKTALAQELKNFAQQNFDANALFADRWINDDGTVNVLQMAQDKYVLNNLGKILQKVSNETGAKRLEHKLKVDSNITVNGGSNQKTFTPNDKEAAFQSFGDAVWKS